MRSEIVRFSISAPEIGQHLSAAALRARFARVAVELILAAMLAATALALAVAIVWGPKPPVSHVAERAAESRIDIDLAILTRIDPFASDAPAPIEVSDDTALTLFGVRNPSAGRGSAIIGVEGAQFAFSVGDEIVPGITLRSIASDHVMLERGGRTMILEMSGKRAPSAAPPVLRSGEAGARRDNRDFPSNHDQAPPVIEVDSDELLAEAGFRPRMRDGQLTGYVVGAHSSGANLLRAGLAPGDVVVALNGTRITAEMFRHLGTELGAGAQFQLTVERGTNTRTVTLQVPEGP